MNNIYFLKIYDENLISFDMDYDLGLKISNIKILFENKNIFPYLLQKDINEQAIANFLNARKIPKNRAFVNQLLSQVGVNINDTKKIIDISKGLSLNDSYWIIQDETLKFDDYNLYENEFSEVLSLIAFTGYSSRVKGLYSSPEFTTNGMLPKCWRRINNEIYLYKGSTAGLNFSNTGYEPYSEYYASQLIEKLGFYGVKYDLDEWKNQLVSISKLFTSKDVSFVPIYQVYENIDIRTAIENLKDTKYFQDFKNMIILDSITANSDRHFGNFGFLRDNKSGELIKFAPIFDNGEGLLSKADVGVFSNKEKFKEFLETDYCTSSTYGAPFKELIFTLCDRHDTEIFRKLLTFEFTKHDKYNLDDERLEALNYMVQEKAKEYLELIENK